MPRYIARFAVESCIRLNVKSYFDGTNRHKQRFPAPSSMAVVFDNFSPINGLPLPDGLIVQVAVDAIDIEAAIQSAGETATGILNGTSLVSCAAISRPELISVYDASAGIEDREFLSYSYDRQSPRSTRRAADGELAEFWQKYDQFHCNATVGPDHKSRVLRAIDAYRRALSDPEEPLTEFIVLWTALEGMDCVYRRIFPTAQSAFKDGMRDVFDRLGQGHKFNSLERLRNDFAHGNIDLAAAHQSAVSNIDFIRSTVVFMVLRIIQCDEPTRDRIVSQTAYKGVFLTNIKLTAKIRCQPGDVENLDGHPKFDAEIDSFRVTPQEDRVSVEPIWSYDIRNIRQYSDLLVEVRGDSGASVRVEELGLTFTTDNQNSPLQPRASLFQRLWSPFQRAMDFLFGSRHTR